MRERIENDLFHIEIMLDRLLKIDEYSKRYARLGVDLRDEMVLDNLAFQLIQAGEQLAMNKLSATTKEKYDFVDWRKIKDLRNFNAHSYVKKNNRVLLYIIQREVPEYVNQLSDVQKCLLRELELQEEN